VALLTEICKKTSKRFEWLISLKWSSALGPTSSLSAEQLRLRAHYDNG